MNLTDAIWRNMHAFPGRPALCQQGRSLSFGDLQLLAERIITRLRALGVHAGDCVAVDGVSPTGQLTLALALARMGAVSTTIKSDWPASLTTELLERHAVVLWITDSAPSPDSTACRCASANRLFAGIESEPPSAEAAPVEPDAIWRIALSSGTTGIRKSIPLTHSRGRLLHLLSHGVYRCGAGERLLVFSDMSIGLALGHSMMMLAGGGAVVLAPAATADAFFSALAQDAPTQALTTTALAARIISAIRSRPSTLPPTEKTLHSITVGGSTVPPALAAAIRENLCSDLRITYGSTETGTLAVSDLADGAGKSGVFGRLMPWVEAQATDREGRALPPGQMGLLRFRSPTIVDHYLGDEAASARAFVDGWYYPGDTGAVDSGGLLTLGGRADDLINLQGVKLDPARIEQVVASHPGVREAAVVAVSDPVTGLQTLVAVVVADTGLDASALQALCREQISEQATPRLVVTVDALPLTPEGKPDRGALASQIGSILADRSAAQNAPERA